MHQSENQDHGNEVFVFIEQITPVEGREDDVLSISRESAKLLKGQPGMIQTLLTRSEKKGGKLCTVTVWQKKADFQAFLKTEAFAALVQSEDFKNIKEWMGEYEMQMMDLVDGWHG